MERPAFLIKGLEELPAAAEWLLNQLEGENHLAFQGDMGAGKTTLIQAICKKLGVQTEVNSPTFALVYEYAGQAGRVIYHFDFYRIEDPVEALDFGLEEYLADGGLCLMEWPEKIEDLLPGDVRTIRLDVQPDQSRLLTLL